MTPWSTMLRGFGAVGLLAALGACGACLEQPASTPGDANLDADEDGGAQVRLLPVGKVIPDGIYQVAVTDDDKTLVYCGGAGRGFADAETLEMTPLHFSAEILAAIGGENGEISDLCEVRIFGEYAYVFHGHHTVSPNRSSVVKISLASRQVVAGWAVPLEWDSAREWHGGHEGGIEPTRTPGRVVVTPGVWEGARDGIDALFLDLDTGTYTLERIAPSGGELIRQYISHIFDEHIVLGSMWFKNDPNTPIPFAVDLDDNKVLYRMSWAGGGYISDIEPHEPSRRFVAGSSPSSGWALYSMDTGAVLAEFPYVTAGFENHFAWLDENRLIHAGGGSQTGTITVMDTRTGAPLAETTIKEASALRGARLNHGKTQLYVGGVGHLIRVPIPADL